MKAEAADRMIGGPHLRGRIRSEPRVEWGTGVNDLTDHLVGSNSYDNSCGYITAIAVRTQIRQDLLQDECNMMSSARVDPLLAQKRHDFFSQMGDRLRPRQHIGIESGHGEDTWNGICGYEGTPQKKSEAGRECGDQLCGLDLRHSMIDSDWRGGKGPSCVIVSARRYRATLDWQKDCQTGRRDDLADRRSRIKQCQAAPPALDSLGRRNQMPKADGGDECHPRHVDEYLVFASG